MKTKYFILAALAGLTFAGCSSDDLIAEAPPVNVNEGEAPIVFTSNQKAFTRADFAGADAASKLGNMFVVSGFKGATTASPGSIVFDNYLVNWAENTANTTESNSSNWEYVGITPIKHAADNGITSQTIKYWDYSVGQYDFIAWSTGEKTPVYKDALAHPTLATSEVRVTEIVPTTATSAAYTFEGTAEALSQCYISDLVTVYKGNATGTAPFYNVVEKGYNKPVTLKFRQLGTKVRIGIYETVPGYSVKNVQFYSAAAVDLVKSTDTNPATSNPYGDDGAASENASAKIFTTTANNINREGTYTVYFPTVDAPTNADNNQAHITFDGTGYTQDTKVNWGGLNYTGRQEAEKGDNSTTPVNYNIYLGRTSNTASFAGDPDNNYYDFFLPNEAGTNLNLRVNYTLESIDGSGEEIVVKGATAQVPSIYTTWKPGYAYTYLFKISDKTNGYTGVYDPTKPDDTTVNSDPAGLYPITFDAVVVNAEDGNNTQETITLVSTPSITTYQNGSNVVNNNEYTVLSTSDPKITGEIYVTVNDGGGYVEVSVGDGNSVSGYYTYNSTTGKYVACGSSDVAVSGTKYYELKPVLANSDLVELTGKVNLYTVAEGTTEAQVIDAMQMQDDDKGGATIKGRNKVALTEAQTTGASPTNLLQVTNEVTYGVDGNKIDVATGKAAKFVPAANTTYAFVYTKKAADSNNDEVKYSPIAFNDATVTTKYRFDYKAATAGDAQKGVVYFTKPSTAYEKKTAFIGQGVSNLYTRSGNAPSYTYTAATNYAVSNTTYYYTLDGGTTYTAARNIDYADFNKDGADQLYVKSGAYFVAKTETEPVDGTAYYYKNGDNYEYCVILPEQVLATWYELDTTKYVVKDETAAVDGQTYFDKYTVNDGVYYVKVIKIAE